MATRQSRPQAPLNSDNSFVIVGPNIIRPSNRPVTITPLSSAQQAALKPVQPQQCLIKKVLIKATSKGAKSKSKDNKTFTLRNINPSNVTSLEDLKKLIKEQLGKEISDKDFDVGFFQDNAAVTVRSNEDISDIWQQILTGKSLALWCDGMVNKTQGSKRKRGEESDDEEEPLGRKRKKVSEDRELAVEKFVRDLKAKHGDSKFTAMQYRVWAEMLAGGVHASDNDPPNNSMFQRCENVPNKRKSSSSSSDVVEAIDKLSQAFTPQPQRSTPHSPVRQIVENRSKCYKQLSELKNLQQSGVLSDEEFEVEKGAIMAILSTMK